jgi:hypothetical protein
MVYSPNKVVACVKVDGKILREDKNVVTLPFGSEYSVFIKNLNPRRIKVKVTVDGTDATEGAWLVVEPNSDFELERFIRAANMDRGNRFKFIERTGDIEEHRGIKADDGLIRIEYQVENPKPVSIDVEEHHHHYDHYDPWPRPPYRPRPMWERSASYASNGPLRSRSLRPSATSGKKSAAMGNRKAVVQPMSVEHDSLDVSFNEQGITVPGSESTQQFRWTAGFETGASEVIVLQLRGVVAGKEVIKAVTVETKLTCSSCGKTHPSTEKFCGKCGTALQII